MELLELLELLDKKMISERYPKHYNITRFFNVPKKLCKKQFNLG